MGYSTHAQLGANGGEIGWSRFLTCNFTSENLRLLDNLTSTSIDSILADGLTSEAITAITELSAIQGGPFCEKDEDLTYLAHINTPNVARDMNLVRNLTGYETIRFWGFSYGTVLGTVYAVVFPERVGRMVLDGE